MSNKSKQKTLLLKQSRQLKKSDILFKLLKQENISNTQILKTADLLTVEFIKEFK